MAKGRTPENAKKRWWVFSSLHPSGNEICLKTISRQEKTEKAKLKSFFQRHMEFSKYFTEDAELQNNSWTTELHLSFPMLRSENHEGQIQAGRVRQEDDITFPPLVKGEKPTFLVKCMTSLMFEGDFFDRYWTCRWLLAYSGGKLPLFERMNEFLNGYQISHDGSLETDEDNHSDKYGGSGGSSGEDGSSWSGSSSGDSSWVEEIVMHSKVLQQRRFLELLMYFAGLVLLNESAAVVLETTTKLLEQGKAGLRNSFEATQGMFLLEEGDEVEKLDYKGFLIANQRFQEFQTSLRRVEAHFAENLATIDLWLKREKAREAERPRWSFSDESRYRSPIMKITTESDNELQKFKHHHSKISNLIKSTTEDLELMRNYLDIAKRPRCAPC